MDANNFEFGWNDRDADDFGSSPAPGSVDPLEAWLEENHHLWQLGLRLAATAQFYRRAYKHIPFNQSGWYSPN